MIVYSSSYHVQDSFIPFLAKFARSSTQKVKDANSSQRIAAATDTLEAEATATQMVADTVLQPMATLVGDLMVVAEALAVVVTRCQTWEPA